MHLHKDKFLKGLVKDFFSYGAIGAMSKFVGFFTIPIYARFLSPEDFGVLELVSILLAILPLITTLQLETSFLRLSFLKKENIEKKELFTSGLFIIVPLSAVITFILIVYAEFFATLVFGTNDFKLLLIIALLQLPFNNIFGYTTTLYRVQFKRKAYSIIHISFVVLNALVGIYLVAFLNLGLLGLILSRTIIVFVFAILSLILNRRELVKGLNLIFIREMLSFSIPLIPGSFAYWLQKQISRIYILAAFDLYNLGIYAIASKLALPLVLVISSLKMAWTPYSFEQAESKESPRNFNKFLNIVSILSFILLIFLTTYSKEIISIFATDKFKEGSMLVGWIILMNILTGKINLVAVGLSIKKRTLDWSFITVIGILSSFAAMYLLSKPLGIMGVVIGGVVGELIQFFLMGVRVNKTMPGFFEYTKVLILLFAGITYVSIFSYTSISELAILKTIILLSLILALLLFKNKFKD